MLSSAMNALRRVAASSQSSLCSSLYTCALLSMSSHARRNFHTVWYPPCLLRHLPMESKSMGWAICL